MTGHIYMTQNIVPQWRGIQVAIYFCVLRFHNVFINKLNQWNSKNKVNMSHVWLCILFLR